MRTALEIMDRLLVAETTGSYAKTISDHQVTPSILLLLMTSQQSNS